MLGAILVAVIVVFTSWRFCDLWFDNLGGLSWFWTTKNPGILHVTSKLSFILGVLCCLGMAILTARAAFAIAAFLLFAYHMSTLLIISERSNR